MPKNINEKFDSEKLDRLVCLETSAGNIYQAAVRRFNAYSRAEQTPERIKDLENRKDYLTERMEKLQYYIEVTKVSAKAKL